MLIKTASKAENENNIEKAIHKLGIIIPLDIFIGFIIGALGISRTTSMSSFLIWMPNFTLYLTVGTIIIITLATYFAGALFHIGN